MPLDDIDTLLGSGDDLSVEDLFPSGSDDTKPEDTKPDTVSRADFDALQTQFNELKNKPAYIPPREQDQQRQLNPLGQDDTASEDALVAQLEKDFLLSPGKSLLKVLKAAQNISQQNSTAATFPAAAMAKENFKYKVRNDPTFDDAEEEFDKAFNELTPQQLANIPAAKWDESLNAIYDLAVGRAARKKTKSGGRAGNPPPIGAGSSGSSGRSSSGKTLSAVQRQMVESAREYGMSDDDIKAMLKDES